LALLACFAGFAFTHTPRLRRLPLAHLTGFFFGFAFDRAPLGGSELPTPLNVTLDGVAKIGGAPGTP
jgi:hypothetical protein